MVSQILLQLRIYSNYGHLVTGGQSLYVRTACYQGVVTELRLSVVVERRKDRGIRVVSVSPEFDYSSFLSNYD